MCIHIFLLDETKDIIYVYTHITIKDLINNYCGCHELGKITVSSETIIIKYIFTDAVLKLDRQIKLLLIICVLEIFVRSVSPYKVYIPSFYYNPKFTSNLH